jgi:hypothetical protein
MLGALKFFQVKRSSSRKVVRTASVISYEEHGVIIDEPPPSNYNYDRSRYIPEYLYDPAPEYARKGKPIFLNREEAANWLVEHLQRELLF